MVPTSRDGGGDTGAMYQVHGDVRTPRGAPVRRAQFEHGGGLSEIRLGRQYRYVGVAGSCSARVYS